MTRLKRSLLVVVSGALIFGGGAVLQAREQYYGVCSQLNGFPGMLQKAGLLFAGTCVAAIGGPPCGAGNACTVNGNSGKCRNTGTIGGPPVCTCVATPTPNIE